MAEPDSRVRNLLSDVFDSDTGEVWGREIDSAMTLAIDELLTDEESRRRFPELWQLFHENPDAEREYQLAMEIARAEADRTMVGSFTAPARPDFLVSEAYISGWLQEQIRQGKQWAQDQFGGICILIGQGLQMQLVPEWSNRSNQQGDLLLQRTIGAQEGLPGWEIIVSAFVEDAEFCHVDVSLYNLHDPHASLGLVPLSLYQGDLVVTEETDSQGNVSFVHVSRDNLDQVVVRIQVDL